MRKKTGILLLAGLLLMAGAALAVASDITGDWELTSETPRGTMTRPMHFVQKGEALEVTTTRPGRPNEQGEPGPAQEIKGAGTVKGNDIEWTFTMKGRDGEERTVAYKGTIDGDTMKGTFSMGQMGDTEWTAKRVKK